MKKYNYILGFDLPTHLSPKPNKVKYTKPTKVNGVWYADIITPNH